MSDQARISLRPSTFAVGGGLIDDVDVIIKRARFTTGYGADGKTEEAQAATTFFVQLEDKEGNQFDQYFSMGNGFVPSVTGEDETNGLYLVSVGEKSAINQGCNGALFMTSMVNAGLPEDLLDGDINAIEGTVMHVNRVPAPKRSGLPKRQGPNADREQTILLCTTILSLPGEAKASKGKPANANVKQMPGKAAPVKAAVTDVDPLIGELEGELIGIFAATDATEMKKVEISKAIFNHVEKSNPNRAEFIKMAVKDDVLRSMDSFTFDGKVLKLAS